MGAAIIFGELCEVWEGVETSSDVIVDDIIDVDEIITDTNQLFSLVNMDVSWMDVDNIVFTLQ